MRILHIIPRYDIRSGGGAQAALRYSEFLEDENQDVSTILFSHHNDSTQIQHRLKNVVFSKILFGNSLRFPANIFLLIREVRQSDIIILPGIYLAVNTITGIIAILMKRKIFLMPYDSFNPEKLKHKRIKKAVYRFLIDNLILRRSFRVHAANQKEASEINAYQSSVGITDQNIVQINYGFEFDNLKCFDESIKRQPLNILYFARVDVNKGLMDLISAFEKLSICLPDARLNIAGAEWNSIYTESCKLKVANSKISKNITWHGELTEQKKKSLYKSCELYVLPSYAENFGITVLEALLNDCMILISDQVPWEGLSSICRDSVFKVGDVNALCHAMQVLLNNSSIEKQQHIEICQQFAERYSAKIVSKELVVNLTKMHEAES